MSPKAQIEPDDSPAHRTFAATKGIASQVGLGACVGVLAGIASAIFLTALDAATNFRGEHLSIVFALPVAGLVIGWFYQRFGAPIAGGTDIIVDRIEGLDDPETPTRVPLRMAPMVLIGTILTHLFGGSAGREGTAIQMGSSLADSLARVFKVSPDTRRTLVIAGVAGGFGSVFGTPIAGLVFALEFSAVGRLHHAALLPALAAAVIGDLTTAATGVLHTPYPALAATDLDWLLLGKWVIFAIAIAIATATFIELTHALKRLSVRYFRILPYRLFMGGLGVVLLWQLVGTDMYLGLGVPSILAAFSDPDFPAYAFALKILFTAVTLSAGFLGGEVTPLFFVGAALGAALAGPLGIPQPLAAAVGLAAVFGAASNTPLALSIMAVEIVGGAALPHVAIVAFIAYLLTGQRSIYGSQRLTRTKFGRSLSRPIRLKDFDHRRDVS